MNQIQIHHDGGIANATVDTIHDVPGCVFAFAQYHGSGDYVAMLRVGPNESPEPLYRLSHEWLEAEEEAA